MRIVILGCNGQVASDVTILLSAMANVELVPIARSHGGSAFLRYHGIAVQHMSLTDVELAKEVFSGADVIANFALAGGLPRVAMEQNEAIIRATFEYSPPSAVIVFFSTLAILGEIDENGSSVKSSYSALKIKNERYVRQLAKKLKRQAYSLRLGHVSGPYQNITQLIRDDILSPPVCLPEPDRISNVTCTATIADALVAIGERRAGSPGLYDLVNEPQWTWRELYEKEASDLGKELQIDSTGKQEQVSFPLILTAKKLVFTLIRTLGVRSLLTRLTANLPASMNRTIQAEYFVDQARIDISSLHRPAQVKNMAAKWPALKTRNLPGLRTTRDLLDNDIPCDSRLGIRKWPTDKYITSIDSIT